MKKRRRIITRAFTLIELMVVLVIMSLITIAFIENQSKFDSSTIMRSLAYQVALSIRQAQVYGTSVVQNTQGGGVFGPVFGASFGGSPNSYFIFSDSNPSSSPGQWDPGATTLKTYTLSNTYAVYEICAVTSNGVWRCTYTDDTYASGGLGTIATINISFKRPNPDAVIEAFKQLSSSGSPAVWGGESYTTAYVELQALNGDTRVIKVTLTGQITVCGIGNIAAATGVTLTRLKAGSATC